MSRDAKTNWLASLRKDRDDWSQMLSSLGALFVLGAQPNWGAYDRPYQRRRVALPTYPFQRERHWFPVASAYSTRKRTRAAGHPLLGMHVPLAGRPGEHVWFGELSLERFPWMDDHRVQGVVAVPAAAYVEMAIAAAVEEVSELPIVLTRIKIENVLCSSRESSLKSKPGLNGRLRVSWSFRSTAVGRTGRETGPCMRAGHCRRVESRCPQPSTMSSSETAFKSALFVVWMVRSSTGSRRSAATNGDPAFKVSAAFGKAKAKR